MTAEEQVFGNEFFPVTDITDRIYQRYQSLRWIEWYQGYRGYTCEAQYQVAIGKRKHQGRVLNGPGGVQEEHAPDHQKNR